MKPEDNDGRPVYVALKPGDIKQRLELFQPRRPGYGLRKLDNDHVNKLATRIKRKGEIDPPLVVKFETVNRTPGSVDGQEGIARLTRHHRLCSRSEGEAHRDNKLSLVWRQRACCHGCKRAPE